MLAATRADQDVVLVRKKERLRSSAVASRLCDQTMNLA